VFDISDPTSPVLVGGADTGDAEGVAVTSTHVLLADGYMGLDILPLQCRTPVPVGVSGLEATAVAEGIRVRWQALGGRHAAFTVRRGTGTAPPADSYVVLHRCGMIPGGGPCEYLDRDVRRGETYAYKLAAELAGGGAETLGPVFATVPPAAGLALFPARPNPARGQAALGFDLPGGGNVRLAIYDLSGRIVRRLVDGPARAGRHAVAWDGRSDRGRPVARGIYLARLTWGRHSATMRLVLER
jgi:hypothetical protein